MCLKYNVYYFTKLQEFNNGLFTRQPVSIVDCPLPQLRMKCTGILTTNIKVIHTSISVMRNPSSIQRCIVQSSVTYSLHPCWKKLHNIINDINNKQREIETFLKEDVRRRHYAYFSQFSQKSLLGIDLLNGSPTASTLFIHVPS